MNLWLSHKRSEMFRVHHQWCQSENLWRHQRGFRPFITFNLALPINTFCCPPDLWICYALSSLWTENMPRTLWHVSRLFYLSWIGARPPVASDLNVAYNQNPKINSQNNAVKLKSFPMFGELCTYVNAVNANVSMTRKGATTFSKSKTEEKNTSSLIIRPISTKERQ